MLKARSLVFDEEDTTFKRELAEVQAARDDYEGAAKTLERVKLDQTNRDVTYAEKADVWLLIAEHWFAAEDSINAETYVNKAAHVMHHVSNDRALTIRYKHFQAKISDSKRKFNLAAWEYYGLSNMDELEPDDQVGVLKSAMTCAVLTPAGDTKYRLLSVLHKDERSKSVEPHFELLDKFFMGHVIKPAEVQNFEKEHLEDH